MTNPLTDKQIDRLIAGYLAGSLSAAALPHFERWLRTSPEHPRRVARLSVTDYCMHEVCQDTKADYLLQVLNQIDEAAGPAQLVTLHHLHSSPWHRYRLHAVFGAIAAALLFAVVLTTVLLTGSDASTPPSITDNTPTKPAKPAESAQPILRDTPTTTPVATLTATHNAVWASPQAEGASAPGSLTPGSKLHPGTRLTLTAGFAEITTNDGAVAIIQAPATIELTHNDNAIELHAGKLLGICETDSSKGFLVRTPHMDVIDLGTEFGVEIIDDQVTATVFNGKIELTPQAGKPQPLIANQSARLRVNGNDRQLHIEQQVAQGFDALRIRQASLVVQSPDTQPGAQLSLEDVNADWRITAINGKTLDEPLAMSIPGETVNTLDSFESAKAFVYIPASEEADTIYQFQTSLRLPDQFTSKSQQLVLRFRVDNRLESLQINGVGVPVPDQDNRIDNFRHVHTMIIPGPLRPGDNTFDFEIRNIYSGKQESNSVGIQVAWQLQPIPTPQAD